MKHCWGVKQTQTVGTSEKLDGIVLKRRSQISLVCAPGAELWRRWISVRSQTGQMGTQLNNQLEKKPTKSLGKFSLGYFDPFLHTCAYMRICTYICHSEKKRLIGRAGDAERDRDQRSADALPRWFADGRADFSGTCFKEHRQNQRQRFQYNLVCKRTELVNSEVTLHV